MVKPALSRLAMRLACLKYEQKICQYAFFYSVLQIAYLLSGQFARVRERRKEKERESEGGEREGEGGANIQWSKSKRAQYKKLRRLGSI